MYLGILISIVLGLFFFGLFLIIYKIKKILNFYLYPPRQINKISPEKFNLDYENIEIKVDEKKICAWFFKGKSDLTLIFVPGFVTNRSFILERVYPLLGKEFNAVLFDPQGQGDSEGEFLMGAFLEKDVKAIIDYLEEKKRLKKFILFGTSLGATFAIVISAKMQKKILATIADSPFANVFRISSREVFHISPFLAKIFLPLARVLLFLSFGEDLFKKMDALSVVNKVSHILLIHGKNDKVIDYKNSLILFKKAKEPKEIWLTEGEHCNSFELFPKEYPKRILNFIKSQVRE
jgi:hypothetical protein